MFNVISKKFCISNNTPTAGRVPHIKSVFLVPYCSIYNGSPCGIN